MFDISITVRSRATKRGSLDRRPMPSLDLNRWIQRRSCKRSIGETLARYLSCTCVCVCVCVRVRVWCVCARSRSRPKRSRFPPSDLPSSRAVIFSFFFLFFSFLESRGCAHLERDTEKVAEPDERIASPKVSPPQKYDDPEKIFFDVGISRGYICEYSEQILKVSRETILSIRTRITYDRSSH